MSLKPGSRLGPYEVVAAIGAGGMGEVCRARDTTLNRDVALKTLPQEFWLDADRVARFKREAQVLASLNHPHIAAIYGFEAIDGVQALVLELVDGLTLAERIAGAPLPLDETLTIARQIADGLAAAHEQGIIHRDLKPANIKLRPDGTVKLLDFGLAKALDDKSGGSDRAGGSGRAGLTASPTITTPAMTQMGVILGTAPYMSPEQAKGRAADKRSDVWAFGCVVYEMLTGRRAFEGDDVSDTLAAVLRADPDWSALPADVPASIRTLLRGCLVKDQRARVADLAVAQFVIADPAALERPRTPPGAAPETGRRSRWTSAAALGGVAVLAAALGAAAIWLTRPRSPDAAVTRFSFLLPEGQLSASIARHFIALSPDGTQLVYGSNNKLFLRSLSEFDGHSIPGTESTATLPVEPAFSPDGGAFAFFADDAIKRIQTSGGALVSVCSVTGAPFGITWDATGIVFADAPRGVFRCPANGGAPEQLAAVQPGEQIGMPQLIADGSALLFGLARIADGSARWDSAQVVVQTLKSGARKTIVQGGSDARYLPTGHLIYARGGVVYAVRFDPVRQTTAGAAVPVLQGVRRSTGVAGAAQIATSRTGTLVYVPGPSEAMSTMQRIATADRAGVLTRTPAPEGPYVHVRASRDGKRLAVGSDDGKQAIVWIYDLAGTSAMRRLTLEGHNRFPIWSPDGERVAFQSDREGDLAIFSQRADGTGPIERLTKPTTPGEAHVPESWAVDGQHLSFSVSKDGSFKLWVLSIQNKNVTPYQGVLSSEPIESVFSPDGRWIAYSMSPNTGGGTSANRGVFLQPFPPTGAVYQAPRQRLDFHPVWTASGHDLVYVATASSGQLVSAAVTTSPVVGFGPPVLLPARVTANRLSGESRAHDILPDGRFIGLIAADPESPASAPQIRVVLNWFDELRQRVPAR